MEMIQKGTWKTGAMLIAIAAMVSACSSADTEKPAMTDEKAAEEASMEEKPAEEKLDEEKMDEEAMDEETTEQETEMNEEETDMMGNEVTEDVASPLLKKGETATFSFPNEGEFSIICDPHPVMKMKVTVAADAEVKDQLNLDIAGYEFSEKEVVVAPGTSITWTNQDSARHNVAISVK
jgi:plastocyanin